jgi:hypothetical protein
MELAVVPVFQSEIAPEKARGFVVGTYQISLFVCPLQVYSVLCILLTSALIGWWFGHELRRPWHR